MRRIICCHRKLSKHVTRSGGSPLLLCPSGQPSSIQAASLPHISPLAGKTDLHVKNSKHFVMAGLSIDEDEMLVSFDVTSLFTNVPIDEAAQVIRDKLQGDETLVDRTTLSLLTGSEKLLEACLMSTYFSYMEGTSMSSERVQ